MKSWLAFLTMKAMKLLPFGLLRNLGTFLGHCNWLISSRAKKTTLTNLKICFPDLNPAEQRTLAKQSLCETAKAFMEASKIWQSDWNWLNSQITGESNENLLTEKLQKNRGLIVITLHLGNWEVAAAYLAQKLPLTALYQTSKYAKIDNLILQARQEKNMQMAPSNPHGIKKLLQALRNKQAICILPDQVPDRNTGRIISPFFNKPAWTMSLIHNLIKRTECEVCYCYALRAEKGFHLYVADANPDIFNEQLEISAAAMNADLENIVRKAPSQYQWEYKRFRQLPPEQWVSYDK
ncbi:lysophospholipid acyltransferase family protein [Cellvibrio sp. NN19]|uniref:lysophospholipid acyltransferase family protein n=1 Tax=Cellvibrio chitinivorans TaxID=3102792 RepID=UPI002B414EEB|nr:lysophospholipid acyltransferase family protein [Cellvibrio sp. NN19]